MEIRKANWLPWAGFLLSLIAFFSYFLFFVRFPVTRDFPWANLLLFGLAAASLIAGLRRALARATSYRGKISGPILAALSAAIFAFFTLTLFVAAKRLPPSTGAPRVGQKAPEFSLSDTNGRSVSLSELLAVPVDAPSAAACTPRGVLLVFYRGYW